MTRALMTGITGLRTHQQQLDVVANNLANMNTVAFKAQTVDFSDLMYNTLRSGSSATESSGGLQAQAIGTGVQIAEIGRRFTQGTLQSTGEILDFGLNGEGFFTLIAPGGEDVFTRAGSFAIDVEGRLVESTSGLLVKRFGDTGEPINGGIGFQDPEEEFIRVPFGATIAGSQTGNVDVMGNLPSSSSPPAAEVLTSFTAFEDGSGPASAATLLNDLTLNTTDYGPGDQITIAGTSVDGSPFTVSLAADTATLGDLVNAINGTINGATAAIQPNGTLTLTADNNGAAALSLSIEDDPGNVGASSWLSNSMVLTTDGSEGDRFELSMDIFDSRGENHRITFDFRKTQDNSWDVETSIGVESGVMIDGTISNVNFNEDGSFSSSGTTGIGDPNIEIQFNSISAPQTISVDFSDLTHFASDFSLTQTQDGFSPGTLVSIRVSSDGEMTGLASNGTTLPLAQLAIANFSNNSALDPIGGNFFQQSLTSGEASIGKGLVAGRGQVVGGQLESSNVDIAFEFTRLIIAQRGFSANARTITVSDEMLEELNNIIR
ncbi:MAG: flagellar hook-basal body complex protein [Planctomycetota bacterium]